MSHRLSAIPYRLIAQVALYLSAGLLVIFGLFLLASALGWGKGPSLLATLLPAGENSANARILLFLCALLVCGVGGFALALPWLPRKSADCVLLHTNRGEVTIPLYAVEEYLQREAIRLPGVDHLRVRAARQEGTLAFHLQALVTAQVSIPKITEEIQSFVEHEVRDVIGLRYIGEVHLAINRISNDTRPIVLPALSGRPKRSPCSGELVNRFTRPAELSQAPLGTCKRDGPRPEG